MTLTTIRRLFITTVLVQGLHMVEHVLQVMQRGLGISPAHGLIGAFNLEWIHFTYNAIYLIPLGVLFVVVAVKRIFPLHIPSRVPLLSIFLFLVIAQGYHLVEHTVKLQQHIATGLQGTPGILGAHIDLIWFHFFLNLAVYLPLLLALYGLRGVFFHRSTVPICTTPPCPRILRPSMEATITCPKCGKRSVAPIPTDRCQYFYICPHCNVRLKPKGQDCCVFCSYADRPCSLPRSPSP